MVVMRRAKIASTSPAFDPKWYCAAELLRCPAAAPISRSDTAAMPRSANSRSAAVIIASRLRAATGDGAVVVRAVELDIVREDKTRDLTRSRPWVGWRP